MRLSTWLPCAVRTANPRSAAIVGLVVADVRIVELAAARSEELEHHFAPGAATAVQVANGP